MERTTRLTSHGLVHRIGLDQQGSISTSPRYVFGLDSDGRSPVTGGLFNNKGLNGISSHPSDDMIAMLLMPADWSTVLTP